MKEIDKEKVRAITKECVDKLTAKGRRSCAGCHNDYYCPIYGVEERA